VQKVRKEYQPTSYLDLMRVCDIWVDAAMQLTDKEMRVMERLVKAQYRMASEEFNCDLKVATA
jgi:DSF synthase